MTTTENAHLLDLEWDFPQVGFTTIRGYLCAVLARLWIEKDDFTFKRAFGFSHWQRDLLPPLIAAGVFEEVPEDLPFEERAKFLMAQEASLHALIASLIPLMTIPNEREQQCL